jgi:hypothetical protein
LIRLLFFTAVAFSPVNLKTAEHAYAGSSAAKGAYFARLARLGATVAGRGHRRYSPKTLISTGHCQLTAGMLF